MTVTVFKQLIVSLFGHKHYAKERIFYMQVYAAVIKNNQLDQLADIICDMKNILTYSKQAIKYPASFFTHFVERAND